MSSSTGCWFAYTTVDSNEKAVDMARSLVQNKNVACINVLGPVESIYEWQGRVEQTTEWMLMMKCSDRQCEALKAAVASLHDYDVPELIMFPIEDGHAPYLQWVQAQALGSKA
jgi:periplasmic divalent cation tolerance protein